MSDPVLPNEASGEAASPDCAAGATAGPEHELAAQPARLSRRNLLLAGTTLAAAANLTSARPVAAQAQPAPAAGTAGGTAAPGKPNILMIMGDDIGWFNPSIYHRGIMGYRTPNVDRIGTEGAMFTDWYGEQSCTAGRAAFITGQSPIQTGLTKVGLPGADIGLRPEDPSVAEFLKALGYATGQFGKNHLGDKDEFLPTNHGFDEFLGNLYHLNAEEEPENPDYPKNPEFRKRFGPRGVIRSSADGKIEDTGPLTKKRMETIDEETTAAALDFIDRQQKAGKPWFCYFNSTRMHVNTHLKAESDGRTGKGLYPDGMVEHDGHVGQLLKKLDDLGVAQNTIVVYTTDNGAEVMTWPDGGTTPFRGEKATNWEGGFRVPTLIRWPGVIKPGTIHNEMFSHYDLIPTFCAAGGEPDIVAKCLKGYQAGGKTFKVHLDGYNLMPFFQGSAKEGPRREFIYWNDDGALVAVRVGDWKVVFKAQEHEGIDVWRREFTNLRAPKLFNLRADPFERGDSSIEYEKWFFDRAFVVVPTQAVVAKWLESFKEFPIRQKPASFNLDEVMARLNAPQGSR
ncbi:arylsulfatase [Methylobacterium durans]|uniref:Arylsulfatase n=1 Tax=Methylobacterium durans TaxID=2202825 RepID=A0A2U8WAM5_9HYPH|nr:arylsulfatase [Methylobacterium durans]AWN43069.1 arylsulfatase [Methylobacterium durans]